MAKYTISCSDLLNPKPNPYPSGFRQPRARSTDFCGARCCLLLTLCPKKESIESYHSH